jgi:hypothetical protein
VTGPHLDVAVPPVPPEPAPPEPALPPPAWPPPAVAAPPPRPSRWPCLPRERRRRLCHRWGCPRSRTRRSRVRRWQHRRWATNLPSRLRHRSRKPWNHRSCRRHRSGLLSFPRRYPSGCWPSGTSRRSSQWFLRRPRAAVRRAPGLNERGPSSNQDARHCSQQAAKICIYSVQFGSKRVDNRKTSSGPKSVGRTGRAGSVSPSWMMSWRFLERRDGNASLVIS